MISKENITTAMEEIVEEIRSQPVPFGDGREIVDEVKEQHPQGLTRRELLTASLFSLAGLILSSCLPPIKPTEAPPMIEPSPTILTTPEIVHGVEVYGLGEEIKTKEDLITLTAYVEEKTFPGIGARLSTITREELRQLREEVLNPHERYVEIVAVKSAYDDFQGEQVDFVEWVKAHFDVLNQMLQEANPKLGIAFRLKRIIVVDDQLTGPRKNWWEYLPELKEKAVLAGNDDLGRNPADVDIRFVFGNGQDWLYDREGVKIVSDINDSREPPTPITQLPDGRIIGINPSLIHEFGHELGARDYYWYQVGVLDEDFRIEGETIPPGWRKIIAYPMDIMSGESFLRFSPAAALEMYHAAIKHDFRGYQVEEPGFINDWRLPNRAKISIYDREGKNFLMI